VGSLGYYVHNREFCDLFRSLSIVKVGRWARLVSLMEETGNAYIIWMMKCFGNWLLEEEGDEMTILKWMLKK
jgi:hypothetical protein